jgi:hypothetical protein
MKEKTKIFTYSLKSDLRWFRKENGFSCVSQDMRSPLVLLNDYDSTKTGTLLELAFYTDPLIELERGLERK